MRKHEDTKSLSSAQLPRRAVPISAVKMLKEQHENWEENHKSWQSEDSQGNPEFAFKMALFYEILAEMVNPQSTLNPRQCFWVQEMVSALPRLITKEEAIAHNFAALTAVNVAQYINACRNE